MQRMLSPIQLKYEDLYASRPTGLLTEATIQQLSKDTRAAVAGVLFSSRVVSSHGMMRRYSLNIVDV